MRICQARRYRLPYYVGEEAQETHQETDSFGGEEGRRFSWRSLPDRDLSTDQPTVVISMQKQSLF